LAFKLFLSLRTSAAASPLRFDRRSIRSQPALQAKHWFAEALLGAVRTKGATEHYDVALTFPEMPRYRALLAETEWAIRRLGIVVFFVREDGTVERWR
jgi:hypothetical protein